MSTEHLMNPYTINKSDCKVAATGGILTKTTGPGHTTSATYPGMMSSSSTVLPLSEEEEKELSHLEGLRNEKTRLMKRLAFKKLSPEKRQNIVDYNSLMNEAEKVNGLRAERSGRLKELNNRSWAKSAGDRGYGRDDSLINEFTSEEIEKLHCEAVLEEVIDDV